MFRPLLEDDFEVPSRGEGGNIILIPIETWHIGRDYEAWMESLDWDQQEMIPLHHQLGRTSINDALLDLGHIVGLRDNRACYTYAVVSEDEKNYLGCTYIHPSSKVGFDAQVSLWLRPQEIFREREVGTFLREWVGVTWPFEQVGWPRLDISWDDWLLLPDKKTFSWQKQPCTNRYWLPRLVPDSFDVPDFFETDRFKLVPLGPDVLALDGEAITSSVEFMLKRYPYYEWTEEMPLDFYWTQMAMHLRNRQLRAWFDYAVLSPDESRELACVYFRPSFKQGYDIDVKHWVRETEGDTGLEDYLCKAVTRWLEEKWPFDKVLWLGRNVSWDEYNAWLSQREPITTRS